jgi:3-oxoacyl-[acyl-carrier-protein] synthase III
MQYARDGDDVTLTISKNIELTQENVPVQLPFKITGTGFYVPARIETAEDLSPSVGRSSDWIRSRTGIARRHVSDEPVEAMAAAAAREALRGETPDLVINASLSPRQLIPDTSVFVLRALGLTGVPGFSIHATCMSFLVALRTGAALLQGGWYRRILIVSSEKGTLSRNFAEPESSTLIGDAAAAAVIEPAAKGENCGLLGWHMATFPEGASLAEIRGCGTNRHPNASETRLEDNLFHMDGPAIFRFTKNRMPDFLSELYRNASVTPDQIDLVIPHQPSGPGVAAISPVLGIGPERVINIVGNYGNCVAASLPMALAYANSTGRLARGDQIMLLGSGAGISIAAAVIRW